MVLDVGAMVNNVYNSINSYFNHLGNVGYQKQSDVNKLILYTFIQDLLDKDFRGYVNEKDYGIINRVLYCLYGSTCLIPYPDYYNSKNNKVMYLGSVSELANRVAVLEKDVENINDTTVVFPETSVD